MTGWQVWGWTVALLGPPALFGTAIAVESWLDRWRANQAADQLTRLDRLDGLRRHPSQPTAPEDHPDWGRL